MGEQVKESEALDKAVKAFREIGEQGNQLDSRSYGLSGRLSTGLPVGCNGYIIASKTKPRFAG